MYRMQHPDVRGKAPKEEKIFINGVEAVYIPVFGDYYCCWKTPAEGRFKICVRGKEELIERIKKEKERGNIPMPYTND